MSVHRTSTSSATASSPTDRFCPTLSPPNPFRRSYQHQSSPPPLPHHHLHDPHPSSATAPCSLPFHISPLRIVLAILLLLYVVIPSHIVNRISNLPSFSTLTNVIASLTTTTTLSPSSPSPNTGQTPLSPQSPPIQPPPAPVQHPDCTSRPGNPSVAIVAACKNRHESLAKSLPTWLAVRNVRHIVVIDWASNPPLRSLVRPQQRDPRLRLVRVRNEPQWVLSRAYNLAFNFTPCQVVVRTDCDYVLQPDFLTAHDVRAVADGNAFYTGNWLNARDDNEVHLNGALVVATRDFFAVGGYDERIQTYGWDDEELYQRLQSSNLTRRNASYDHVAHVLHGDASRAQSGVKFAQVQIDVNQLLLDKLSPWSRHMRDSNESSLYAVASQGDGDVADDDEEDGGSGEDIANGRQMGQIGLGQYVEVEAVRVPPPLRNRVSQDTYDDAWALALGRRLADDYRVPWDVLASMDSPVREELLRELMELQSVLTDAEEAAEDGGTRPVMSVRGGKKVERPQKARVMVVHCVGADVLGRLRAFTSGMAFARRARRVLVVVWEMGDGMAALVGDLFDVSEMVVMNEFKPQWPLKKIAEFDGLWNEFVFYNYVEEEDGAKRGEDVVNNVDKHVYFKAGEGMTSSDYSWWDADNEALRSLQPVEEVDMELDKLEERGIREAIGVHVGSSAGDVVVDKFAAEMERMTKAEEKEIGFYVVSDNKAAVTGLRKRFGSRVLNGYDGTECVGSSGGVKCVRRRVVDMYAMSMTRAVLASSWGGWAEMAERLGGAEARLLGRDFGCGGSNNDPCSANATAKVSGGGVRSPPVSAEKIGNTTATSSKDTTVDRSGVKST